MVPDNDRQRVQLPLDAVEADFWYGDDKGVPVFLDGTADMLKAGLEGLDRIYRVEVAAGSTADAPWEIALVDAATENGAYYGLEYAVTKKRGDFQFADNGGASDNSLQKIGLRDGGEAVIRYGQETVVLNTGMTAEEVATALGGLHALFDDDVAVTDSGTTDYLWEISLTPKDGGSRSYERISFAIIETVTNPAVLQAESVVHANRVQELVAPSGPLTVWYGDSGADVSYDAAGGLTGNDIEAALELLEEVDQVSVTGSGTAANPWRVFIFAAEMAADGGFYGVASECYELRGDAIYKAGSQRQSRDASLAPLIEHNQVQVLALDPWETQGILWYGEEGIAVEQGLEAAELERRLELTSGVSDVSVDGNGSHADPWQIHLLNATIDDSGDYHTLRLVAGDDTPAGNLVYSRTRQTGAEAAAPDNDRQQVQLPVDVVEVRFWYGAEDVIVALDGTSATAALSGNLVVGDTWKLVIDEGLLTEVTIGYQVQQTDESLADVASGLADALNLSLDPDAALYTASSSDGTVRISRKDWVGFTLTGDFADTADGGATIDVLSDAGATLGAGLERLAGITEVAVVAGDTADAPWEIVLLVATIENGSYRNLEYAISEKRGATQLADNGGSGDNAQQSIGLPDGAEVVVWYGGESVVLDTGMTAEDLVTKLGSLDALRADNVEVTVSDTPDNDKLWKIELEPKEGGSAHYERISFAIVETVSDPERLQAESVVPANRVQELEVQSGPLTVWYGDSGVDLGEVGLPAADAVKAALESLEAVNRVSVTGMGTADEPWQIVVVDAERAAAGFHGIALEHYELGGGAFYEAGLKRQSRDASPAAQAVSLENWQDHARLIYGGEAVEVSREMTALEVAEALESLDSIRDVRVSGGGTVENPEAPWHVVFLDADLAADGNPLPLRLEVGVQRIVRQFDVTTVWDMQHQWIDESAIQVGTTVQYGEAEVTLAADDIGSSSALETKLRLMVGLEEVTVSHDPDRVAYLVSFPTASPDTQLLRYDVGNGMQEAEVTEEIRGSLTLPVGIAGAVFSYQGESARIDLLGVAGPDEIGTLLSPLGYSGGILVDGSGTFDDPWVITLRNYDPNAPVSVEYEFVQQLVRQLDDATGPNPQEQWIDQAAVVADTMILYGDDQVTLKAADIDDDDTANQANRLQARLRLVESLEGITVSYDQSRSAYLVAFATASPDTQTLRYDTGSGIQEAEVEDETRGFITLPLDLAGALFRYQDKFVVIDLLGVAGQDEIRDLLSSLGTGSDILVEGSGTFENPWSVTFRDYDPVNPVTVEYDLGGLQGLADTSDSYQVIERLVDDDTWAIDRDGADQYTVYSTASDTAGDAVYISAHQTVEEQVPRMLEKPVWADLDGDRVVEETGDTDWFEDPTWVNDQVVDTVKITGSSVDDYFLIGHEVLNAGTDAEETHTDTVQVTHQRLGDPGSSTVVITLRGLDLNHPAESVENDQVSINALEGDDHLIAGFLPNSTEIHANQILTARAVDELTLNGGDGNDWIVGSPYADTIEPGEGDDTVTGNGGVDSFGDADGVEYTDTLIEARDLNFSLSDSELAITGLQQSALDPTVMESVVEREGVDTFECFMLFGGAHDNNFAVYDFTKTAWLDGTEGSDTYLLTLSGPIDGKSSVYVEDSGTGSTDSDSVEVWGGDVADTLHLDADTSLQQLVREAPGAFKLYYGGKVTAEIGDTAMADDIAGGLRDLTTISEVTVTGSGTTDDPWMIEILDAEVNPEDKFLRLETRDATEEDLPTSLATVTVVRATVQRIEAGLAADVLAGKPDLDAMFSADGGDAEAQTQPSISLSSPDEYQRVYYDVSAENVEIHGGGGSDTVICDDSMAALYVYGDSGNDNFLIGRVLKTKTVMVEGQETEVVDGPDGITAGVSFNGYFYGGSGDDYFEVNHNVGELELFGESGDDMFFLKAQLQDTSGGAQVSEMEGGKITAGAGDDQNNVAEKDNDVLINYIENNRVEVFGGSGFDTVVVAGTTLDDEFYIFTDNDGRQFLYGAGIKLESFDGIERLAVITGGGDDTVYLYGLNERLTLLLNLGSGDDKLIVGGPEMEFQVAYPASNAIYTVQHEIFTDVFQSEETTYNDVVFKKREMSLAQKEQAWQSFFNRWIETEEETTPGIDETRWNLLETNLAAALKLYAQGVEKARRAPVYRTTLNGAPLSYDANVNALEQLLQLENSGHWADSTVYSWTTGMWWWKKRHYSSPLHAALVSDDHAELPDDVPFETLAGIVPSSGYYAGSRQLDEAFYREYLIPVVNLTMAGDMISAAQVRQGTELGSQRIASWGYEPDLYLGDLYSHQIPVGSGWLSNIKRETDVLLDYDLLGDGARLFWDLISLFYEVDTVTDKAINVEQTYVAQKETGAASYRFDSLPERIVDKTLPANCDISRIAGVVRLGGGAGNDTVTINAYNTSGTNVTLQEQLLELADYSFDVTLPVPDLPAGATHEDLQAALVRANKETKIGVLDQLAGGEISSADVEVSVDTTELTYTMRDRLDGLDTEVKALQDCELNGRQSLYCSRAQDFVLRGKQLLGDEVVAVAEFSLDALDELLNATVLREMIKDSGGEISPAAESVEIELENLRGYLTLIDVTSDLRAKGYEWTAETALKIYRQNSPDLSNRTTTYDYRQEIWKPATYDEAAAWNQGSGLYSGRLNPLDPDYEHVEDLKANDLDNERGTRSLRKIGYTVNGTDYLIDDPSLVGNQIEMEKAYSAALDNLDFSYYTYSCYGVDGDGNSVLESVAIRRLNDTDPDGEAVDGKSALIGGVYLTEGNWEAYLDALVQASKLSATDRDVHASNGFTDQAVETLITTAFGQTLRTDVTAPIMDGLVIEQGGNVDSVDIKSLQDDAGFYLPKEVTVNRSDEHIVAVPSAYVRGRRAGTEYTVAYDRVLALPGDGSGGTFNDAWLEGQGLWLAGFESLDVNVNEADGSPAADTVDVQSAHHLTSLTINAGDGDNCVNVGSSHHLTSLTVNTGDGNDTVDVRSDHHLESLTVNTGDGIDTINVQITAETTQIITGPGADAITIQSAGGETTISSGSGNDIIEVNHLMDETVLTIYGEDGEDTIKVNHLSDQSALTIDGGNGGDEVYVRLAGSGTAAVEVFDAGNPADGTDSLWVDGSGRTNCLKGSFTHDSGDTLRMEDLDANAEFTFTQVQAIETFTLDLSSLGDVFTLNNLLPFEVTVNGNAGDDILTVKRIGGNTRLLGGGGNDALVIDFGGEASSPLGGRTLAFEGGVGSDTLTVAFGEQAPVDVGDLRFSVETLIADNNSYGVPVAWQVTAGSVATSDAGDIVLINDSEHVAAELQIVAGEHTGSTLEVTGAGGPVTIDGGTHENGYKNRIELVQGSTTVLSYVDSEVPVTKLTAGDGAAYDQFGNSVAISGDWAIVGASFSDSAYIFQRKGDKWVEVDKLTAGTWNEFGYSVAISDDMAIVGAPEDDRCGAAYVFRREGQVWVEEARLVADDGSEWDQFGHSVAISGSTAVVGVPEAGSVYVFERNSQAVWEQTTNLGLSWGEATLDFNDINLGVFDTLEEDGFIIDWIGYGDKQRVAEEVGFSKHLRDSDEGNMFGAGVFVYRADGQHFSLESLWANDFTNDPSGSSIRRIDLIGKLDGVLVGEEEVHPGSSTFEQYMPSNVVGKEIDQLIINIVSSTIDKFGVDDITLSYPVLNSFGYSVAISGDTIVVGDLGDIDGSDSSAYTFMRNNNGTPEDPSDDTWGDPITLLASDVHEWADFGCSVAVSGDTAIVGAYVEGFGIYSSAHIFQQDDTGWVERTKLVADDQDDWEEFGYSVAISGDTAVVGATGSAYLFRRENGDWLQSSQLIGDGDSIDNHFGHSVAISGDTAIVGDFGDDDNGEFSGSAYIFTAPEISGPKSLTMDPDGDHLYAITPRENALVILDASDLSVRQAIVPTQTEAIISAADGVQGDNFGRSVAVSGDWAIVLGSTPGSGYAFWLGDEDWGRQTKLLAEDGTDWNRGGSSVAMYGDWAIVGVPDDENDGKQSGSAYIFRRNGESWVQEDKLVAADGADYDKFGSSVAISGDTAIVGAYGDDDNGDDSGSAYVFRLEGHEWVQQPKLLAADGTQWENFGSSVAISGDWAIVGTAWGNSAYIFWLGDENWGQQTKLAADGGFGYSVAISGDTAVVGAYQGPGGFYGSAYIFQREDTGWVQEAKLVADDAMEEFGCSVAISGDTVAVGAQTYYVAGSAYVFRRENGGWVQLRKVVSDDEPFAAYFGSSVAVSRDTAIVGHPSWSDPGSAYVFSTGTLPANSLAVSPDGKHLYQVSGRRGHGEISVFNRDDYAGTLTLADTIADPDNLPGVDLIEFSPMGDFAYVATDLGVAVYSRDADTGALTLLETLDTAEAGRPTAIGIPSIPRPEGWFVHVAGEDGNLITYFYDVGEGQAQEIGRSRSGRHAERPSLEPGPARPCTPAAGQSAPSPSSAGIRQPASLPSSN